MRFDRGHSCTSGSDAFESWWAFVFEHVADLRHSDWIADLDRSANL